MHIQLAKADTDWTGHWLSHTCGKTVQKFIRRHTLQVHCKCALWWQAYYIVCCDTSTYLYMYIWSRVPNRLATYRATSSSRTQCSWIARPLCYTHCKFEYTWTNMIVHTITAMNSRDTHPHLISISTKVSLVSADFLLTGHRLTRTIS